jgi:hypothetical protein
MILTMKTLALAALLSLYVLSAVAVPLPAEVIKPRCDSCGHAETDSRAQLLAAFDVPTGSKMVSKNGIYLGLDPSMW